MINSRPPLLRDPIIGSGRIKRRVLQKYIKKIAADIRELRRIKERKVKPVAQVKITKDERVVLNHWNSKGQYFTTHKIDKEVPTWTLQHVIKSIKRRLKKCSSYEICSSIDAVDKIFQDPLFKFRIPKLTLYDFFYIDKRTLALYKKNNPKVYRDGPLSWFEEGREGFDYLEKKYSDTIKDGWPLLTEKLQNIWVAHMGNGFKLKPRHTNVLRRLSQKIVVFGEANKRICPPEEVVNRLQYMINNLNYKPPSLHFLISDYFWEEDFTNELIRWGKHDRRDINIP